MTDSHAVLREWAAPRDLDADRLVESGLVQVNGSGAPQLTLTRLPDEQVHRHLRAPDGGGLQWCAEAGSKGKGAVMVLGDPHRAEVVLPCEGESDAFAAWACLHEDPRFAVLAIPGTNMVTSDLADFVGNAARVIVATDGDGAGGACHEDIAAILSEAGHDRIERLRPPDGADLRDLIAKVRAAGQSLADLLLATDFELAQALDDVRSLICEFIGLDDAQATAATLSAAHTWIADLLDICAYLSISSAEKRSGKTRLLELVGFIGQNPLKSANTSSAALYRSLADSPRTPVLDEVDAIFGPAARGERAEELRGILNSGYLKGTPVIRCVGPQQIPTEFPVFGPKGFAGIGSLPDTIADRCVPIRMRRAKPGSVGRFKLRKDRPRARAAGAKVGQALVRITAQRQAEGRDWLDPEPVVPEELDDRAHDIWESLLAVAEGDPERSIGELLLDSCEVAFSQAGANELVNTELAKVLAAMPEEPWGSIGRDGGAITTHKLATMLKEFRVTPIVAKREGKTVRVYKRESFVDPWQRYPNPLKEASTGAPPDQDVTSQPSARPSGSQCYDPTSEEGSANPPRNHENPHGDGDGYEVTSEGGGTPGETVEPGSESSEDFRESLFDDEPKRRAWADVDDETRGS